MTDTTLKVTTPPIALTIAGSDSSGGAGIQADLKTFMALGVFGASVVTALTAQNTKGVTAIHTPPGSFVRAQIDAIADDMNVAATKVGMLANKDIAATVASALRDHDLGIIVVDPVIAATSGDALLESDAQNILIRDLFPVADLITPNLHEAALLTGRPMAEDQAEVERQAKKLLESGCSAVLIKGGHASTSDSVDTLVTSDGAATFTAPRISTQNTHGTGCTLSAAITAHLARGTALSTAIAKAKDAITQAIASAADQELGSGHGPIDHAAIAIDFSDANKKT